LLVDGVLRVYAQTRYLLFQNILQLCLVAGLAGTFLRIFGLEGAVLVTLFASLTVRGIAVVRISRLMQISLADALPWRRVGIAAACAIVATAPAFAISRLGLHPVMALLLAGASYALTYAALWYATQRRAPLPVMGTSTI
jgi:hypothetical protein